MKIALGTDHAGYAYKERIKEHLRALGHKPVDFGTFAALPKVDYPDFVRPAAQAVARGECERGIVLGGSGNGEAMAANRFPGVRCDVAYPLLVRGDALLVGCEHNGALLAIDLDTGVEQWPFFTPKGRYALPRPPTGSGSS